MNPDQNGQLLTWLDEEHRKDKVMMGEILGQLDQHLTQITGLTKGLQDLEERLARVQSQSLRYSQIEQALGQVKTEVTLLFEQFNQRVQQREDEAFKVRQKERERLDKAVAELGDKIDEVARPIPRFASDHDAIRRLEGGQIPLLRGLEELSKRQESFNSRLAVAEEWVKRTGALIAEIQQLAERLRQERADALEVTRRADQVRARQVTEWNEQMKAARREMEDWVAQLRPLLELPKEVRGYLATLRELESDLKQIEPRMAQRQKLLEEFSRSEISTMKTELEKRWNQQERDWDFMREEWSKKVTALGMRFDPLDEWRPQVMEEFRLIREKIDADRLRWLDALNDIVRMQVEQQRGSNARYDQFASDLLTRIETEKAGGKVKRPKSVPES
jgi:DNA repair exonuclease SbcCD ATPase subunit